jgi:hypothetical protein
MYRAAARRVCRCHGRDRDEAQQPPPTCWLPHLATATGVGWLRSFWFSTPPARAPGCRRCAQVFGDEDPGVQDRLPHERGHTRLDLLADVGRYRRRRFRSGPTCARTEIGDGRRDAVERLAQLILLLYLDKRGRPKVRIHGRPRSDRKRRFLLSAVVPSTSTRHPREARPINWAQRGGLASGGENVS